MDNSFHKPLDIYNYSIQRMAIIALRRQDPTVPDGYQSIPRRLMTELGRD